MYHKWALVAVLLTVLAVTWATWRAVQRDPRAGCLARRDAIVGFAVGIGVGGGVGFAATLEWLIHWVVPPAPGHVGYLPQWPWQAVAVPLAHHLLPGAIFLVLWVAALAAIVRPDPSASFSRAMESRKSDV
jgi:hypothetical protein